MKSLLVFVLLVLSGLQGKGDVCADTEEPFGQRLRYGGLCAAGVLLEVLEVVAPVKNIELCFVLSVAEDIFRETGATTYHLLETDAAHHGLEEHEVQDVGHVNACVEHIHRHGHLRQFVTFLEVIDERLGIVHVVVDEGAEVIT